MAPKNPFDHPVGPRRLVPGTDVDDATFRSHPGGKGAAFETRTVVGDDSERPDLLGGGIGEILDPENPEQRLDLVEGG